MSTRKATMPHWFYFTGFDKHIVDHPYGVKGGLKQPLISRPIMTQVEQNMADSSAAGGPRYHAPAAGMEAAGIMPNLDRQSPAPWDAELVNSGQPAGSGDGIARVSAVNGNGWRLR